MRWFLFLWALPIAVLGGWYGLSYHDMNFGFLMLSRTMHDLVFEIYGNLLGLPPEDIPPLVLRAILVDTVIVGGILVFRRRRKIASWYRSRFQDQSQEGLVMDAVPQTSQPAYKNESLSSAP